MQLYNSLSHKKENFIPHEDGKVNIYTCGPTVYHYAHIGNLRSYIMEDILEKYLRFTGLDVNRVMNITDVGHLTSNGDTGDDKIFTSAKREYKTVSEITKFYTDAFFADCTKLNIRIPDTVINATTYVDEYIRVITVLMENEYAYEAGGNIYFDTAKLDKYYVFGDVNRNNLKVGVRKSVEVDDNKHNKTDFVLWFTKSKFDDQELKWNSPWGIGYPGWHIECSCISMKNLGEYLDLHCGGIDNVFPHHTNEIAQSEAYLGHKWCHYWFHVHHLNTTSGKMRKSSGEFITVSLLEEKGYDPLVYRFFCLQSHYRKSLMFSWEKLDNAKTIYNKLIAKIANLKSNNIETLLDIKEYDRFRKSFNETLSNDLNTSLAVTTLYDVIKSTANDYTKLVLIDEFDTVLGLNLLKTANDLIESQTNEIPIEIIKLIEHRKNARREKNFVLADELRDQITALGYKVKETRNGGYEVKEIRNQNQ